MVTVHSGGQAISSLSRIKGTTLGAGEEIYDFMERVSFVGLDGIVGQVDDKAAGVCGTSFAA